ncbi:MAG: Maf family protein [Kiloniellales bacterium]|nr:Maf family protein [Kiloniellales bacterium]
MAPQPQVRTIGRADAAAPPLVLASASPSRRRLLAEAGVALQWDEARVDESEVKDALKAEGAEPEQVAETLSELKAQRVSRRHPGALVIGADQMMECGGIWFDKPSDLDHAAAHLRALSGRAHRLLTSVCVVRDGQRLWHHNDQARLTMRSLSGRFVADYLEAVGEAALGSVGAYQLEGLGAQLFSRVEGDYFTILGLPLLPLLDFLRHHRAVPT